MKKILLPLLLYIFFAVAAGCRAPSSPTPNPTETNSSITIASPTATPTLSSVKTSIGADPTSPPEITPQPTPTPALDLYGCEMVMDFKSGPLEGKKRTFTVLDRSYFADKGDLFAPGQNTAIYYQTPPYLILHSSYQNGNILKPMEAEFLRYYLEYWGESGDAYIQEQIDALIGSQVLWICDGKLLFKSEVSGVTRLSHEASQQLWLHPKDLIQILKNREGLVSEWIGAVNPDDTPTFFLGFCGWGPKSAGDDRYVYFRYLIQFEVQR